MEFAYDWEDLNYKEVYVSTNLNIWMNWYQRIIVAVKYIFGHKSKYGAFDCTLLNLREQIKLRDYLDTAIKDFTVDEKVTGWDIEKARSTQPEFRNKVFGK